MIKKFKDVLEKGKTVTLHYFIDNIEIEIKPEKDSKHLYTYKKQHPKEGFEETRIESLSDILSNLKWRNKPDLLFVNGKEIDHQY